MANKKLSATELRERKKIAKDRVQRTFNSCGTYLKNIDKLNSWDDQVGSNRSARRIHEVANLILSKKLDVSWVAIDEICNNLVTVWSMLEVDKPLPNSVQKHKGLDLKWYERIIQELLNAARGARRRFFFFDACSNDRNRPLKKLPPEFRKLYKDYKSDDPDSSDESDSSKNSSATDKTHDTTGTGSDSEAESDSQIKSETQSDSQIQSETQSAPAVLPSQIQSDNMVFDLTEDTEAETQSRKRKRPDGKPHETRNFASPSPGHFPSSQATAKPWTATDNTKKSDLIPASASAKTFKPNILDKDKPFGEPFAKPAAKSPQHNDRFWMEKYFEAKEENKKWANRSNGFETAHNQLKAENDTAKKQREFYMGRHDEDINEIKEHKTIIKKQKAEIKNLKDANASLEIDLAAVNDELESLRKKSAADLSKDLDDYTKTQIAGLKTTAEAIMHSLAHVETGRAVKIEVSDVTKCSTSGTSTKKMQDKTDTNNAKTNDDDDDNDYAFQRNDDDVATRSDRELSTGILKCPE